MFLLREYVRCKSLPASFYITKEVVTISASKQKPPQFSAYISSFLNLLRETHSDYEWNKTEVNRLDKLTQDYLHMLELDKLSYSERAKVATKLAKCRQLRRESKDTAEILEPLIEFIASDKGKNMINLLTETLGKTRKTEQRMESRTYRYKVLEQVEPNSSEED